MNAILTTFRRVLVLEPSVLSPSRSLRKTVSKAPKSSAVVTEWKLHVKSVRSELQKLLGIKEIDALKLVTANKKLLVVNRSYVAQNINICLEHGLTSDVLMKYPILLYEPNLKKKLAKLLQLPLELSLTISFARLSLRILHSFQLMGTELRDRIYNIQRILNVSTQEACHNLSIRRFLLSKPLNELEDIRSALLGKDLNQASVIELYQTIAEYEFTRAELLKDLWVFKYSEEQIRNRLDFMKQHGVKLKTWMIRCPEDVLYKHLKRESDNRDILGENSVTQYLSQKLQCSEVVAKNIIKKHPQLQNKSLLKISLMIDLLYKHGFTPIQICRVPKVLLHSRKTSEIRLKQLMALGKVPDTLYILTKSQKQYMHHIDNLLKENAKSLNVI